MDRRKAIKNLALGLGYSIAMPSLVSVLNSCTAKEPDWQPVFLNDTQKMFVSYLSDIILPTTNLPGALDLAIPQFIDKILNTVVIDEEKEHVLNGWKIFEKAYQKKYEKESVKATKEECLELLKTYFNTSKEREEYIFRLIGLDVEEVLPSEMEVFLIYKFLITIRSFTLLGFYTSEYIGEQVLSYDPIPGKYEPCIPVSRIGNAWSL